MNIIIESFYLIIYSYGGKDHVTWIMEHGT